ncbi:MAG: hypothetical protein QM534_11300 [Sediminibacterium sp.]|nr:hypothetical protein [Sediminibacterium sp.]
MALNSSRSLRLIFTALFFCTIVLYRGQNSAQKEKFIPKQWEIRDSFSYDFNNDRLTDFVMVVANTQGKKTYSGACPQKEYYPEKLIILLGTGNMCYKLSATSENLFSNDCQSNYYFYSLERRKNTIKINFSSETPNQITKDVFLYLQYITDTWYLIGTTTKLHTSDYKAGYWGEDYNLKTGKKEMYKIAVESNDYEIIEKKKTVTKSMTFNPRPLLTLDKLDIYTISEAYLPGLQ